MKLDNLFVNWKTTSAGVLAIIGGLVRVSFMIAQQGVSEEGVMTTITAMVTGVGLLFARDVNVTSADLGLQSVEKKSTATQVITPNKEK